MSYTTTHMTVAINTHVVWHHMPWGCVGNTDSCYIGQYCVPYIMYTNMTAHASWLFNCEHTDAGEQHRTDQVGHHIFKYIMHRPIPENPNLTPMLSPTCNITPRYVEHRNYVWSFLCSIVRTIIYVVYIHTCVTYIHTSIHICTHMHSYIHIYIHAHMHPLTHTYTHSFMHPYVRTHIHIYTYTYMHAHVYSLTYTDIHTYTSVYIHTHACAHVYTHTHMRTHGYRGTRAHMHTLEHTRMDT